jgi:hypothetical protein
MCPVGDGLGVIGAWRVVNVLRSGSMRRKTRNDVQSGGVNKVKRFQICSLNWILDKFLRFFYLNQKMQL